ncbi:PF20097 family protein [uncultured Dysosmobacter sp.]|uniref:PF20097 family protein n=1 Tax=uncultured Dysosmobacter sp. TaxID=2591384 RepID=UPI002616875E|nr:PF20097 family protein [uncultured Dysosmobacter sp.]
MENKTCPYYGGGLQKGFVRSRANICWTADKEQRAFLLPRKETGDFELTGSDNWRGSGCSARYCPARRLILLPQKEDA